MSTRSFIASHCLNGALVLGLAALGGACAGTAARLAGQPAGQVATGPAPGTATRPAAAVTAASDVILTPNTLTVCPGGPVAAYQAWAREVRASGEVVRLAGTIDSSCAVFADMLRASLSPAGDRQGHACVTPAAVIGLHHHIAKHERPDHKGPEHRSGERQQGRVDVLPSTLLPISWDLYRYIFARGGLPADGSFFTIAWPDTATLWEVCP